MWEFKNTFQVIQTQNIRVHFLFTFLMFTLNELFLGLRNFRSVKSNHSLSPSWFRLLFFTKRVFVMLCQGMNSGSHTCKILLSGFPQFSLSLLHLVLREGGKERGRDSDKARVATHHSTAWPCWCWSLMPPCGARTQSHLLTFLNLYSLPAELPLSP